MLQVLLYSFQFQSNSQHVCHLVSSLIELKPPIDHHLGSELHPQQDLKSNKKVNSTKQEEETKQKTHNLKETLSCYFRDPFPSWPVGGVLPP